jgi:hypothetical protein
MGGGYTLYCGGIANWSKPSSTYVVNFGQGADNGICTGGDTIFNPTKVRLRAFSKTPKYTASFAVTTAGNPTYSSGTGGIPAVSLTSFPVFAYLDINGNNGPTSYRIPMMGCSNPYGIGFSKLSQTGFTVHPGYTYLGYLTDSNGSSFNPQSATCTVKLYDQSSMPTDYDSGWTAIAANYILTFNHKLNKIPSLISVFVADTNDDNPNFCLVVMGHQNGNGWYTHINSIDKQNISVCSGASGISYFWNQSQHKHISYGYVRVFAWL